MIDTKELRRLTQAALAGPDGVSLHWVKLLQDFQQEANPVAISELLDRLEAAESECLEEARLNGMGASREAALMAKLEAAEKERDALRAKIAEMERQEPVGRFARIDGDGPLMECKHADIPSVPLYALPGAQPAPSAPSEEAAAEMGANGGHVVEAERLAFEAWMRGHCWKLGAKWTGTEYRSAFEKGGMVDVHAMRTRELWAAWRDRAALAAPKPEAKT